MMGLLLYLVCVFSAGLLLRYALRLEDFSALTVYRLCVSFFWGLLAHMGLLKILQLFSVAPSQAQVRVFILLVAAIMPVVLLWQLLRNCLFYTSPSPRD